jgi:hypothetical protein
MNPIPRAKKVPNYAMKITKETENYRISIKNYGEIGKIIKREVVRFVPRDHPLPALRVNHLIKIVEFMKALEDNEESQEE